MTRAPYLSLKFEYARGGETKEREVYPLIAQIVSKRVKRNRLPGSMEFDDAMSAVVLSCLKRFPKFEGSRNVQVTTFLYKNMNGAVIDTIRSEKRYEAKFTPTDFRERGFHITREAFEAPEAMVGDISNRLLTAKVMDVLRRYASPVGAYSLIAFYVMEMEDKAIAAELGQNITYVRKVRKEAIETVSGIIQRGRGKSKAMVWG